MFGFGEKGWSGQRSSPGARSDARGLARDETLRLEPRRGGVRVRVLRGSVHLTQSGDPLDHIVGEGEDVALAGRGRVVLMGLEPSRVVVEPWAANPTRQAARRGSEPCRPDEVPCHLVPPSVGV